MSRVLLIGQGPTAGTALRSLLARHTVVGLVRNATPDDPVAEYAAVAGVPLFADTAMGAVDAVVSDLRPDVVVVSSYDRVLGPAVVAKSTFINVHYAPLPHYRGRATVNWALINNEPGTAITIHELVPQLDAGRILFQQSIAIAPDDSVATLYERLNAVQLDVLGDTVQRFLTSGGGRQQDQARATYACTRLPEDGEIDWSLPTERIGALIRALVPPYPGAFTHLHGERLAIWKAVAVADAPAYVGRIPGRVVSVSAREGWVDVLTGDGVLRLLDVQRDGEAAVAPATVIRSVKTTLGLRSADLLDRIRTLEARLAELTDSIAAMRADQPAETPNNDERTTDSHHGWRRADRLPYRRSTDRRRAV